MNKNKKKENILFDFSSKKIIFDPSVLYHLMFNEIKATDFQVFIPDNLLELIDLSKKNEEYRESLKKIFFFFSYENINKYDKINWNLFYKNINKLHLTGIKINDIGDRDSYKNNLKLFSNRNYYLHLGKKINLLGDIVAKIIEFSKKTGITILSKTRIFANLLREKIAILELPEVLYKIHFAKNDFIDKIFDFQNGRKVKSFIGVFVSIKSEMIQELDFCNKVFTYIDP